MADTSIDPSEQGQDTDDIAVDVDTLRIDGIRPKTGDTVELKVGGTISKLVDNTAFVTPTTVNDQPIPATSPAVDPDEAMMAAAQEADKTAGY